MKNLEESFDLLKSSVLNKIQNETTRETIDALFQLHRDHMFPSKNQVTTCNKCELRQDCKQPVLGEGNRQAKLMLVGEAPGEEEDTSGRPFVGKAGQLLDKILEAAGWDRKDVYITNTVKCRPPSNRTPSLAETAQCFMHLQDEIKSINPQVIVCLGSTAAKILIHPTFKITEEHGQWFTDDNGRKMIAIYHPAYILRQGGIEQAKVKKIVWETVKKIQEELSGN